jgi:hypothetical protein
MRSAPTAEAEPLRGPARYPRGLIREAGGLTPRKRSARESPPSGARYDQPASTSRGRTGRSRHPPSWHGRRSELRRRSLLLATRAISSEPSSIGLRRYPQSTRSRQTHDGGRVETIVERHEQAVDSRGELYETVRQERDPAAVCRRSSESRAGGVRSLLGGLHDGHLPARHAVDARDGNASDPGCARTRHRTRCGVKWRHTGGTQSSLVA